MTGIKRFFSPFFTLSILTILLLLSCSKEVYNLSVNTVIADSKTKQPIPGAYFDVTCTFQENIDQSVSKEQRVMSGPAGKVSVDFERGYLLSYKATCPGYLNLKNTRFANKRFPDTLYLMKEPEKTDLQLSILSGYNVDESTPFIRIKSIKVFKRQSDEEIWGYDFINNRATNNLDSADIWLDPKSTTNALIFNANSNGGIYPVFEQEISQSFFLEIEYVPELRYFNTYRTTGTEKGYFVKCRDGKRIVKLVPEDYLCVVEYKQGKNKVTESGIRLNYIIQKDTVNSNKFPLVVIYELLNKAQTTSMKTANEDLTGNEAGNRLR
jgi:hypothetical protein